MCVAASAESRFVCGTATSPRIISRCRINPVLSQVSRFSGTSRPVKLASIIIVAAPATIACANKCGSSSGLCQKSRPSACAKRNALYPAVAAPSTTLASNNHAGGTPNSHHNEIAPPNAINMYPPHTSHDEKFGARMSRQNRSGRFQIADQQSGGNHEEEQAHHR